MQLVARASGFEADKGNECLVAGFSECADGSGIAIFFQAAMYEPDEQDLRLGWDTYCITNGDRTHYGGLLEAQLAGKKLRLIFKRETAKTLDVDEEVDVHFAVNESDLRAFCDGFLRIVRWGRKADLPVLSGF